MTRNYPLYIIDTSRSHGRGREVDYIACTSAQLPWVGEVTLVSPSELAIDQDWEQRNPLCAYSDPNDNGIRVKVKAVQVPDTYKPADLRQLLRRALKEWAIRNEVVTVKSFDDPGDDAVRRFAEVLLGQTAENLRANPSDRQARLVKSILHKIIKTFSHE